MTPGYTGYTFKPIRNSRSPLHEDEVINYSEDEPIIFEDYLGWRTEEAEFSIEQSFFNRE